MKRREFMNVSLKGLAGLAVLNCLRGGGVASALAYEKKVQTAADFQPLVLSNAEWKKKLTVQQYRILRQQGTEPAFTSALLKEHREGVFACAGCGLPLFPSRFKYDSGTGWPSFFDAFEGHLKTQKDYALIFPRTEYHCAKCGGHHGHVFDDGPNPTGLRYCNNGAVLTFTPQG